STDFVLEVQECTRQLHLWRNGFSLNDGSPLSYDDPENKKILDKIFNGQTPHGFFGVQPGERVEVELRPHPDDDYRAPE
ncbi:SEP-domain-containing protein, partial [Amniculicola lignicola CBS 123094]